MNEMGKINIDQLQEEREFHTELWNFRKTFYNGAGETDEFWELCVQQFNMLGKKYVNQYQQDLLSACLADIERRARSAKTSRPKIEEGLNDQIRLADT